MLSRGCLFLILMTTPVLNACYCPNVSPPDREISSYLEALFPTRLTWRLYRVNVGHLGYYECRSNLKVIDEPRMARIRPDIQFRSLTLYSIYNEYYEVETLAASERQSGRGVGVLVSPLFAGWGDDQQRRFFHLFVGRPIANREDCKDLAEGLSALVVTTIYKGTTRSDGWINNSRYEVGLNWDSRPRGCLITECSDTVRSIELGKCTGNAGN